MQIHAKHNDAQHTHAEHKQDHAEQNEPQHNYAPVEGVKPIPNPRGTQTVPQPQSVTPRTPDGRFTSPLRVTPTPVSL